MFPSLSASVRFGGRLFLAAAIVLLPAHSALAVRLVVMNVTTHAYNVVIPAGEQVVTFGIEVRASDLYGAGSNPILAVQNLTFMGNGLRPVNATTSANMVDVQNVQTRIVDQSIENNQSGPDLVPAVQSDLTARQQQSVYADSWWYSSGGGLLQGVNDGSGLVGPLTDPAWQLGPIRNVGTTGFTWSPDGTPGAQAGATALAALGSTGGTNAVTGQYMIYSGIFGPNGSNGLTQSTLASQFVNGVLTVPIAQIVTTGDIFIPGTYSNAAGALPGAPGSGTFIGIIGVGGSNGPTGNGTYNLYGGDPNINTGFFYSFTGAGQVPIPEPGTIVLAALAACGFCVRRKHLASRSASQA